jgi:hypothetical protein
VDATRNEQHRINLPLRHVGRKQKEQETKKNRRKIPVKAASLGGFSKEE